MEIESRPWTVSDQTSRRPRHPEIGLREERSGVRAGVHGFGTRPGPCVDQSYASEAGQTEIPVRPVRGSGTFRGHHAGAKAAGDIYDRRGRTAELGAAVWTIHRVAASPGRGRRAAQALSLWPAHLSRARALGRAVGKPV